MHICIDCRALGPESTGIGAFTLSALEALLAHGHENQFLVVAQRSVAQALGNSPRCSVVSPDGAGAMWGELELPAILEERGVDVLFSPLFTCPVVSVCRHVITLHDVFPESHPDLCTPEFLKFWKARIGPSMRSASHAVGVSEWSKEMVAKHLRLPEDRVSVVHQSVGGQFRPVTGAEADGVLAKHGLGAGEYILYVGAIDPRKNLDRLIEALADVPELPLVLAGKVTVEDYDPHKVAEAAGVADRVRPIGYVPDHDLPALYSQARCFAFPSLAEGFGRPCIEAMGCGVPVVASGRTALPETCGKAALLPDPENTSALAKALKRACSDDKARKRLIDAGAQRAAQFQPERFAADLLAAFESAMNGPEEGLWHA